MKVSGLEIFDLPPEDSDEKEDILREIINEHDRAYGLRLKHPKVVNYAVQYERLKSSFTKDLLNVMRTFNQLDDDSYENPRLFVSEITKHGQTKKGAEIFQTSPLWNGRMDRKDIMDDIFKARFLVLLYSEMAKYIDDVVDTEFGKYGHSVTKDEDRYLILKTIVSLTGRFHDAYIDGTDSLSIALELNGLLSSRSRKKREKVLRLIQDHVDIIQMQQTWTSYNLDDDVLINDLVKMAYVAVTENPDISETTPTKMGMSFSDKREIKKVLYGLGEDILWFKHQKKHRKNPIFYDAFMYAKPELLCSFSDVDDDTVIRIAIRAMYYLSFLINEPRIHRLIQKIV